MSASRELVSGLLHDADIGLDLFVDGRGVDLWDHEEVDRLGRVGHNLKRGERVRVRVRGERARVRAREESVGVSVRARAKVSANLQSRIFC